MTNDNRHPPIPIPKGGFRSNEEEARWLEQTILMRLREAASNAGLRFAPQPNGLYELLLLSLNAASRRGGGVVTTS